jgi:hypothetical protein
VRQVGPRPPLRLAKVGHRSRIHCWKSGERSATITSPPPGLSSFATMMPPSGRAMRTRARKPNTRDSQAIASPGSW